MSYIEGFVIPVPTARKADFIAHAQLSDQVFMENGAIAIHECWGEDVPQGKVTDFYGAVNAKGDETVVFSWIEWRDKGASKSLQARMEEISKTDPRWDMDKNPPPFDGKRMIYGGFEPIFQSGEWSPDAYVQGFVIPASDRQAYRDMAAEAWELFREYGAIEVAECWQEDVPHGQQTDFFRAVQAQPEESVVFSYMTWPSKAVCDAAAEKMQNDERMKMPDKMPFDPQRMIYAGFTPVVNLVH